MAASPQWKVYTADGQYMASCKYPEHAAILMGSGFMFGEGATIRDGHSRAGILWTEGAEGFPASESFDRCVEVMVERRQESYQLRHEHV